MNRGTVNKVSNMQSKEKVEAREKTTGAEGLDEMNRHIFQLHGEVMHKNQYSLMTEK